MKKTILLGIAAVSVFTLTANAQYRPTGEDGITASPKLRQMLEETKKVVSSPSPAVASVGYQATAEDGVTASPKLRQLLNERKAVVGAPSAVISSVGYRPTDADGVTASPKLRQQLNEQDTQFLLHHITTRAEAEELKPGDTVALVCPMCKSVVIHNVTTEKGHIKVMTVGAERLCPGCNSMIRVVGVGKGAHDVVKHFCGKCGVSAFCCATKPGSNFAEYTDKK
jgi:hypothetical protein